MQMEHIQSQERHQRRRRRGRTKPGVPAVPPGSGDVASVENHHGSVSTGKVAATRQTQPHSPELPRGQKEITQGRILDAALPLFAARGFDRASIATIAARAGVSRAAIFWHFGSKQGLFLEVCRRMLQPFLDQLERSLQKVDPRARLFELFATYEHFVEENRASIEIMVRWMLESPKLRASLEQPLLSLHESFARDVYETLGKLVGDRAQAAALGAGLVSLLDGNLVLSLLDTGLQSAQIRRTGLRAIAQLVLEETGKR